MEASDEAIRQAQLKSLQQLYDSEELSDVVFEVGEAATEIFAVKSIMANGSQFFNTLLCGQFKESVPSQADGRLRVQLKSVTVPAFECIKRFAYGLNPNLSEDNVSTVLRAAQYLQLSAFFEEARNFLKLCLNGSNVLKLRASLLPHEVTPELECTFWRTIQAASADVLTTSGFLGCPPPLMLALVSSAAFAVSEEDLWLRLIDWAEAQSRAPADDIETLSPRDFLVPLFPHVRFGAFSKEFFIDFVRPHLLVENANEVMDWFLLGRMTLPVSKPARKVDWVAAATSGRWAKLPDKSIQSRFCKSQNFPQVLCFQFGQPVLPVKVFLKNQYDDDDTVKDLELHVCDEDGNDLQPTSIYRFTSAKSHDSQKFRLEDPEGIAQYCRFWKLIIRNSYGGYSCIDTFIILAHPSVSDDAARCSDLMKSHCF